MLTKEEIESNIQSLETELVNEDYKESLMKRTTLDMYYWLRTDRTPEEIQNRIKRYKEENIVLNHLSELYKANCKRIEVLQSAL